MKTMRKLYDQTMEELDGVCEYSECAMMYKELDPELSKIYAGMAKMEMEHAKTLHSMSQKKATHAMADPERETVDPRLMELWNEMEHAKLEKMALAKAHLDLLA